MNDNAKKWVEAIRSGDYKQGRGQLADGEGKFCCLGVACDLYAKEHPDFPTTYAEMVYYGAFEDYGELPEEVQKWLGLRTTIGSYAIRRTLAEDNDLGMTFPEIADLIETEPRGLFR